jgi:hypothetical protein
MAGLIFVAQPTLIRTAMLAEAQHVGALDLLGATMFAAENWHQSLSDRSLTSLICVKRCFVPVPA